MLAMVVPTAMALACGGGKTGTKAAFEDGRIFVENKIRYALEVRYVNEELGEIVTEVAPSEKKEVSQAVLKGGSKILLRLIVYSSILSSKNLACSGSNLQGLTRFIQDMEIIIDGNITVQVTSVTLGHLGYTLITG